MTLQPRQAGEPVVVTHGAGAAGQFFGGTGNGDGDAAGGATAISAACKTWARVLSLLIAALVVSAGTLTGTAFTVVPLALLVLLVVIAVVWTIQCHPRECRRLRTFIAGAGLGAGLLALLALAGITAPQLVFVLCLVIVLLALAMLIGALRKCF